LGTTPPPAGGTPPRRGMGFCMGIMEGAVMS